MKSNEERVKSIMKKAELYRRKRGEAISTVTLAVCLVVSVIAGVNLGTYKNKYNEEQKLINNENEQLIVENIEGELVAFSSKEELIAKFEEKAKDYEEERKNLGRGMYFLDDMAVAESAVNSTAVKASPFGNSDKAQSSDEEYSKTNIQTEGVDESDIIKTDGKRIYYINNNRQDVKIFEDTNGQIKLVKKIELSSDKNEYVYADSMFLDDKHLVVVANGHQTYYDDIATEETNLSNKMLIYRPTKSFTKIYIYDVNTYELIRKVETEGNLVSSRKIGDDLYLVSNKYLYLYSFNRDDVMPLYKDSLISEDYSEVAIENIRGFKDFDEKEECNYMIVTSLNLNQKNGKVNIETYLGAGNAIYCSINNLYVTKPNYHYNYGFSTFRADVDLIDDTVASSKDTTTTSIHKFALKDGKTTYIATGKVNGTLLNQFSMDEYNNHFRITTTNDDGNNLYVLDNNLKLVGSIENLASGERIYSTRFMGDKAYVVTYKTVDPLFVIDLKNPSTPKVLGELKIPGYSSYLHPLGENYLLGFGEDSVEKSYINWEGNQEVVAYSTGLKMAIFDVSDYSNPKEIHSVKIGGRGSYSELLYNHKALLLDEAKNIMAFPASVNKEAGYYKDGTPMYGDLEFSGALVYRIDVEDGFELKGKITHEAENKYSKFGNIERIIYIGNVYYTVSNGMIKATDMNTMQEISNLKFE